ncbi:TfoX/Sxy family protein [Serinicoccus marinus]|uniref:TfoX/Sxy family protein n=1 Tax=Serinicoccus marinus TaxID=247333 RepID=UPI0003B5D3CF|nr:TfoX/Sxy family protein [Serinicoccus marinus]
MAYDEALAQRIRDLLAGEPGVTEKAMFGGLAFLVDGRMAVAATGDQGVMIHIEEAMARELCAREGIAPMEMRGRPMREWVRSEDVGADDHLLEEMVWMGVGWARAQPPR